MRVLAIVVAIVLILAIVVVARALMGWGRQRTVRAGRWQPVSRSLTNGEVAVRLECPGETALILATLNPADDDFEDRLHEEMSEARQRAAALNSERSLPSG